MIIFPDIFEHKETNSSAAIDFNIFWIDLFDDDSLKINFLETNICDMPINFRFLWHMIWATSFQTITSGHTVKIREDVDLKLIRVVHLQFKNEIRVNLYFCMSKEELNSLIVNIPARKQQRQNQVSRYYFAMQYSIAQIAEALNVPESTIKGDIRELQNISLNEYRRDMKANKKLLGHMTEPITGLKYQIKLIWEKIAQMEAMITSIDTDLAVGNLSEVRRDKLRANKIQCTITINTLHNSIKGFHEKIVDIWDRFGLCGEDALRIMFEGGIDVNVNEEEAKSIAMSLAQVIEANIDDENLKTKMFEQILHRVNSNANNGRVKKVTENTQALLANASEVD